MTYQLKVIDHESAVLTGNPLGDPVRREILVLSPARPIDEPLPVVYLLSGFGSGGRDLLATRPLGESLTDRLSRLVWTGTLPPAHVVLPDCTTRYGGSQYLDSPRCGPYQSYLIDEVVRTVDKELSTVATAHGRAVVGKSSGGYGAIMAALLRPGVFGHVVAHTPDAGFEHCYLSLLTRALDTLSARGGLEALTVPGYRGTVDAAYLEAMSLVAMGTCYAPTASTDLIDAFPCDPQTGAFRDDIWRAWLRHDPVRLVPWYATALAGLTTLFLDAGRRDEYGMRWGARALHRALERAGVPHTYEEHDGGHQGIEHRLEHSLANIGRHWST
jgi:enterochelin esterase-like enzyme